MRRRKNSRIEAAHFGGGRVPLVLNSGGPNSTQTPFLHREGRVESGGYEFNRQEAGGDSGGVKLEQVKSRCEKEKKLLWICVIDQRHWMNQKTAKYQECESRLRQVESADVSAGIEVRKG